MKLKRTLPVLGIALLFSQFATAQYLMGGSNGNDSTLPKIEFGIKAGANLQTISGDTWDASYKAGIAGGMYAGMHKKKFGVRLEVLVSTARYTSRDSVIYDTVTGDKGDFRAIYLDLPLLAEYNIFSCVWLQAGPQYSNLMSIKGLNGFGDATFIFRTSEFSGILGLEARLPKHITAGARYILGLTDMNNDQIGNTEAWKNSAIQLYACYRIK